MKTTRAGTYARDWCVHILLAIVINLHQHLIILCAGVYVLFCISHATYTLSMYRMRVPIEVSSISGTTWIQEFQEACHLFVMLYCTVELLT